MRSRYRINRDVWRFRSIKEFEKGSRAAGDLQRECDEYVAKVAMDLSSVMFPATEESKYLVYLITTFTRSQMIASDLLVSGDLVDAATVMRRQMEVVSRLSEVREAPSLEKLIRRTPNVKHLRTNLKRLYGTYSGIAHGSDPADVRLLGRGTDSPFVALYPRFTEHGYVALHNLAMLTLEYWNWIDTHAETLGLPLDRDAHEQWLQSAAPLLVALGDEVNATQAEDP